MNNISALWVGSQPVFSRQQEIMYPQGDKLEMLSHIAKLEKDTVLPSCGVQDFSSLSVQPQDTGIMSHD